jgi:heme-degrading monooxygenase HmoA
MIIRVFRARVFEGKQEEFEQFFLNKALPMIKSMEGLVSVSVGKPSESTPTEFMMTTVWRDLDSLKGFAGENWLNAVIDPDEADLLVETFAHHYELVSS